MRRSEADLDARRLLDEAIALLYAVFKSKLDGPVVGCSHCTSEDDDRRLRSTPLRQLSGDDLNRYSFKAMTTLGTVDDFKHFLPRILEITTHDGSCGHTSVEIVFDKLTYGAWTNWSVSQRNAVTAYFQTLWGYCLAQFPLPVDIGDYLCGIGQAIDDMSPYLTRWRNCQLLKSLRHLASLLSLKFKNLSTEKSINAFWKERPEQMQQVVDWLVDSQTAAQLEAGFFALSPDAGEIAAELSSAIQQHGWIRTAREGLPHAK